MVNAGSGTVSIIRNTSTSGTVSLAGRVNLNVRLNPAAVVIGDIDGDGKADIIVTNNGSGSVSVLRSTGAGCALFYHMPL